MHKFTNLLRKFRKKNTQQLADARMQRNIARIVSRKLNLPLSKTLKALNSPHQYAHDYKQLKDSIKACKLIFEKKTPEIVDLVIRITWQTGDYTSATQEWLLSEVPQKARELLLMHNRPVEIDWEFD